MCDSNNEFKMLLFKAKKLRVSLSITANSLQFVKNAVFRFKLGLI